MNTMKENNTYRNKEISWLSFNERVMQEAADKTLPLGDRFFYLGIYSNNLEEFFRVRIANLIRLMKIKRYNRRSTEENVSEVINKISEIVKTQRIEFDKLFDDLVSELKKMNINILTHRDLSKKQAEFVLSYFNSKVRSKIFPMMINSKYVLPKLKDSAHYIAVELSSDKGRKKYSIIEVPIKALQRFIVIPSAAENSIDFMFIEDIIRFGLPTIYRMLNYQTYHAYSFKVTRDAGLDLDDELTVSYLDKINQGLKKRKKSNPVWFVYDNKIPQDMLDLLLKKMFLKNLHFITPGGRYHNFRDLMDLDRILKLKRTKLHDPIIHPQLKNKNKILSILDKEDILLHFPYHSFTSIIDLLREASIDPRVKTIKITLYRVAHFSSIVNALINAKRNRKDVTVVLELQARFDEKANIYWANKLKEEKVHVIVGVHGLKIHSKLCLVSRKQTDGKMKHYCAIGTGNFNEDTARIYTDSYLLTTNQHIGKEVAQLFKFLETRYNIGTYKHIIISPIHTRNSLEQSIKQEINNKKNGKKAYIYIKLNNLADRDIVDLFYKASQAGVEMKMIVRGMFSVIPGLQGISENIKAISIIDKYLEHSRYYIFCNNDDPQVYISSADLLPRNLDNRVEVTCPIYRKDLRDEILKIFNIHWTDGVKARILDKNLVNNFVTNNENIRSQNAVYDYLKSK